MSQATYQNDKYKADILASAKSMGGDWYHLPTVHLRIKLKPGVTLDSWVDRWIDYQCRNTTTTHTKLINKWKK